MSKMVSNSDEAFDVIERIAAAKGKEKEAIIAEYKDSKVMQEIWMAALNPFTTYGMAKVPKRSPDAKGDSVFSLDVWANLNDMAGRTLTGNDAKNAVAAMINDLSEKSSELLRRIITKDLRASFTHKSVNRVIKKFIPTFECMLAHKYEKKRIKKWPVMVEPKLDGVRVLAIANRDAGEVKFYSRSGKEYTTFDHLKEPLMQAVIDAGGSNMVFDGEVVSGSFNNTVSQVRKKDVQATDAEFHVFHCMGLGAFTDGGGKATLLKCREVLVNNFEAHFTENTPLRLIPCYQVNSHTEIMGIYQNIRDKGGEGVIVKDPEKPYVCKRNHAWMKIKGEESVDAPIVGAFEGTGKYEGSLGGLIVDVDGVHVRVGGGFSDVQRDEFWAVYLEDTDAGDSHSHTAALLGRLIEVEYHEKTPDGSLRHPRFVRFRDDKADAA